MKEDRKIKIDSLTEGMNKWIFGMSVISANNTDFVRVITRNYGSDVKISYQMTKEGHIVKVIFH